MTDNSNPVTINDGNTSLSMTQEEREALVETSVQTVNEVSFAIVTATGSFFISGVLGFVLSSTLYPTGFGSEFFFFAPAISGAIGSMTSSVVWNLLTKVGMSGPSLSSLTLFSSVWPALLLFGFDTMLGSGIIFDAMLISLPLSVVPSLIGSGIVLFIKIKDWQKEDCRV